MFVILTNRVTGIGDIVSPRGLRYRTYHAATPFSNIPKLTLIARPSSLEANFTTTDTRIQSATVPIKPKVIAAALICVLVHIATTKRTSVPKNAIVAFCTHPLESV